MAIPVAYALALGAAKVGGKAALRRLASKGKDAVNAVRSRYSKPKAPTPSTKPDFQVDSGGVVSKFGTQVTKRGTITVDSAGVARNANYPLTVQGSRAVAVIDKPKISQIPKRSALKYAAKNTAMTSPVIATAMLSGSGDDKPSTGRGSAAVDEVERITREGLAPKTTPPTAKATVKAAPSKTSKVSTAKAAEPPKADNEVKGISVKDMGAKDSVQMHGNVDGYGSQNDTPEVSDPSEGMSEEQLKKIGLETSNAEMAAAGKSGSISRFLEGNIDDANSVAYKKYGAGYGREVLRRKAARK